MAVALLRRGPRFCVKCVYREVCRFVWKQQAAVFSSKSSDRKQPRRTHIKKAKAQPAVDVAKLLEQLFSQRRPETAAVAAGGAHPPKASSVPSKPPITSSWKVTTSNIPLFSKTKPAVCAFPVSSSAPPKTSQLSPQPKSVSQKNSKISLSSKKPPHLDFIQTFAPDNLSSESFLTTSASPPTSITPASLCSEAAECKTLTETKVESATGPFHPTCVPEHPLSAYMVETNVETLSFPSATGECLTKTAAEPVESTLPETTGPVPERPIHRTVDAPAEEVQTKSTDSGVTDVSHTAIAEQFLKTADSSVETLQIRAADLESTVTTAAKDKSTAVDATDSDAVHTVSDDLAASPVLKEVLPGQGEEEETEALGNEEDLDPIQKLFLKKIREYNNLQRLSGGLAEADPDYRKYLSEETAKLQKLYGGGDLSSFPEFTFKEPSMDQDSK